MQQKIQCCGVFAIALATSLLFNVKPEKARYNVSKMRSHLLDLFKFNKIEHPPQDPTYGAPQTVPPLTVIRAKEAEAARPRNKRQSEKTQAQKLNQQKACTLQQISKEQVQSVSDTYIEQLNKSQNELCAKNNDCNNKERNGKVYDINKDTENKLVNNHLQYKNNPGIKYLNKEKHQQETTLSLEQKSIIVQNGWLNDLHMDHPNYLVEKYSAHRPVGTWLVQRIDRAQPAPTNKKHTQILPVTRLGIHWTCCHHDTKAIYVYDSLNSKMLSECQKQSPEKLFPTYNFIIKYPVKLPLVQEQTNTHNCVFAIAFAISLLKQQMQQKIQCLSLLV